MLVGKARAGNLPELAQEVLVQDRAVLAASQNYWQHLQAPSSPSNLVLYALEAGRVLEYGTPESVGLLSWPFVQLEKNISAYLIPANYSSATYNEIHPIYPGATVMIGHQGTIVSHFAVGEVVKYANENGSELESDKKISAKLDTIYDMASLTKVFTTILALQQLERGLIGLNCTVSTYIPDFAVNGKENVTILQLLTHTAGFDADPVPPLWTGYASYIARRQAIIRQGLLNRPGTTYLYSDLSFMTMQIVLEVVTGLTLDVLLERDFTGPLGMTDTFFNTGNLALDTSRIAATEFQIAVQGADEPQRPQPVWGTVHDENAWSLDGVSGHAGIFSTSMNLGIFCQMILNNGKYGDVRILDLKTAGHTGFTGMSMVIDRPSNTFMVLLTNRVHPSRTWSSPNIAREMVGYWVRKAMGFGE
ncbi:putative beta-lactamase [Armillaria gallica]|uniref:Putative beta-lactamase n=1 Tax=Armillaria gallica TaxID=47427 RepID=A0A2H3DHL9_ARMGA|nr:putative beta-lactamase [Armillaria gallica]